MFELLKKEEVALEDAFTAAYNAIRVLQYRTRVHPGEYAQFLKEHEATGSDEIIDLALRLISEIEERENVPVARLDPSMALVYEASLASIAEARAREELASDPTRSRHLLQQLEKEVAAL
jgi:hypothetical protein